MLGHGKVVPRWRDVCLYNETFVVCAVVNLSIAVGFYNLVGPIL